MANLNTKEKIQIVKRYLEGSESYRDIARDVEIDNGEIRYWVKKYQYHGDKAFIKDYTNYTLQFKLDVLNYMYENGTSIRETAAIFNLPYYSTLRRWQCLFNTKGAGALISKNEGRLAMKKEIGRSGKDSVRELQEEVERLRMENAYLKKLNTLVQNKEKSPKKTRRK